MRWLSGGGGTRGRERRSGGVNSSARSVRSPLGVVFFQKAIHQGLQRLELLGSHEIVLEDTVHEVFEARVEMMLELELLYALVVAVEYVSVHAE